MKVEKNVPMPTIAEGRKGGGAAKYPFADMGVTDSFAVARDCVANTSTPKAFNAAKQWGLRNNARFRWAPHETQQGMIRIWRVQ